MSLKVKNRHSLKSKEIKVFQDELKSNYDAIFFDDKSSVDVGDFEGLKIIFVDNEPSFMIHENKIVFTLHGLNKYKPNKKFVVVDMGAIRFITNGADVMGPGIVDVDKSIVQDDSVWICDERHKKPLAVGIAVMNADQMSRKEKGKAVRVVHYVGDLVWKFSASDL